MGIYKKWQYAIYAKIGKTNYLIWQYSKHFHDDEKLTKKGLKLFDNATEANGTIHSLTAIQWVTGLKKGLLLENNISNSGVYIVKNGMFNPHYRLNNKSYPDIWFKVSEVEDIYFEMHLYDVNSY